MPQIPSVVTDVMDEASQEQDIVASHAFHGSMRGGIRACVT
jgi:hypothetical protein